MRPSALSVAGAFILAHSLFAAPRESRKDELKAQAQALLTNASTLTDIRAPGSTPFVLVAKVHLQVGSKSVDGLYGESWAAPGRSRQVLAFPDFDETEVIVDNKRYVKRSRTAIPFPIWEFRQVLNFTGQPLPSVKPKIKKASRDVQGGTEQICIDLTFPWKGAICLNPATAEVLTCDTAVDASRLRSHYEFNDYVSLGSKRFPRTIIFRGPENHSIAIQITRLLQVSGFAPDEFTPPRGADAEPLCAAPVRMGVQVLPPFPFVHLAPGRFAFYLDIGPEGNVRYADVLEAETPALGRRLIDWITAAHFPIRKCGDTGIEYQAIFQLGHF